MVVSQTVSRPGRVSRLDTARRKLIGALVLLVLALGWIGYWVLGSGATVQPMDAGTAARIEEQNKRELERVIEETRPRRGGAPVIVGSS